MNRRGLGVVGLVLEGDGALDVRLLQVGAEDASDALLRELAAAAGFRGYLDDVLTALAGADRVGVLASLRVALAERAHRPPPQLNLVMDRTGDAGERRPEHRACRQAAVRGGQKLRNRRRVQFDTPEILQPLFRAMTERGVSATLFVDIDGVAESAAAADAHATAAIDRFFRDVWTFGLPKPDIYFEPRTAASGRPGASLHAKCVVVDDEKTLITPANFTTEARLATSRQAS